MAAWRDLVTSYCRANDIHILDVQEALASPLFNNQAIARTISYQLVMTGIVAEYPFHILCRGATAFMNVLNRFK
jgi:hypothetical protein